MSRNNLYILFGVCTLLLGYLQSRPWFSIFGFRPDVVLATLLALALIYDNFFVFAGLAVLSFLVAFQMTLFTLPALVMLLLSVLSFFGLRFLPWLWSINLAVWSGVVSLLLFFIARLAFVPGELFLIFVDVTTTILLTLGAYIFFERIISKLRGSLSHL